MTTTLDKPRIQCRYTNPEGVQCPLDAESGQHFCRFHEPIRSAA